eukprot:scaffold115611_cov21-Tisochrysis_lutea.AAC.5
MSLCTGALAAGLVHLGVGPPTRQGGAQCTQRAPDGLVQGQGHPLWGLLRQWQGHEVRKVGSEQGRRE